MDDVPPDSSPDESQPRPLPGVPLATTRHPLLVPSIAFAGMILLVLGAMDYGSPPTKPQPLPVARASAQIEPATNDMPMDDASPLDEHEVGAEHTLPHAFSGLESDEERQSEFDILWKADKEWWNYPSTVRGCMRASYVRNQLATYKTVRDRCSEHYH